MEHLDLLFNQHLSRLVSCCVYGTIRMHNVVVAMKVHFPSKPFPTSFPAVELLQPVITFLCCIFVIEGRRKGTKWRQQHVQRVNQAVAAASPHHGMEVFQADDESIGEETEEPVRNVRQLYNDVFLPRMRPFLQQKEPPPEEPKKKGATTKVNPVLRTSLILPVVKGCTCSARSSSLCTLLLCSEKPACKGLHVSIASYNDRPLIGTLQLG